jgi:hypothetical protein
MKAKLTTALPVLLAAGEASAHASASHAFMHNIEHLFLLSAILAPALLLVRPAMRRLAANRAS